MSKLAEKFRDVYGIPMNTKLDSNKLSSLVFKYGEMQLIYTLNRLSGTVIRSEDLQHPYDHLDLVAGRMASKYADKSNLSPGNTLNFSSKRRHTKKF